jgi:hypothetical protein
MASDNKGTKAAPAPKKEAVAKTKSTSGEDVSKAEAGETAAAAPSNYSRGEGQKPVTRAYKENWNAIFRKKTARKTAKNSAKKKKR